MKQTRIACSFRLSRRAVELLARLASQCGGNKTAALERAIRLAANKEIVDREVGRK